jgi:soluble lytic murein transglycosylase
MAEHSAPSRSRLIDAARIIGSASIVCIAIAIVCATACSAQTVETLARAYARSHAAQDRAALARFAAEHKSDEQGALALLALGSAELSLKRYDEAVAALEPASKRLRTVADHAGFMAATAGLELGDYARALQLLAPVWKQENPLSPYTGRAAMVAARCLTSLNRQREAVALLRGKYDVLPQPAGDLALGVALEAAGDLADAAVRYQSVFYGYPLSDEATQAREAIARLTVALGERMPAATPAAMVARATKLLDGGRYGEARAEFESMIPSLSGASQDSARMRVAVADHRARKPALVALSDMRFSEPELDAERLYWVAVAARRGDDLTAMSAALAELARSYPRSHWRAEALVAAGNYHALANRSTEYEPLFRTCFQELPGDSNAPYCHWMVAYSRYLRRDPAAGGLLRDHLKLFPKSEKATASLYFLGRLAEAAGDPAGARAWIAEIDRYYPNTYYSELATARLKALGQGPESEEVRTFLRGVSFPERVKQADFSPDEDGRARLARARVLTSAAQDQAVETELRFAARRTTRPEMYAMELARAADRREAWDQGVRYMKAFAPGYTLYPLKSAPADFWRLVFPIPYREPLVRYSEANGLDPFLVAALVRQESEFSPTVISHANAYGLAQLLPSTARELARRSGLRPFRTNMLFQPDVNLRLGTIFLASLIRSFDGQLEPAIASYNAGRTRPAAWAKWNDYREPAEFVEAIPIAETRTYVQLVLRNAAIYRYLYGRE